MSALRDDRGETLTGLLTAMAMALVLLSAVGSTFVGGSQTAAQAQDRIDAVARARLALDRVTTVLNSQVCLGAGRPPVAAGSANEVVLHASIGDEAFAPARHRFALQGTTLVEDVTPGSGSAPDIAFTGVAERRILQTDVSAPGGEPLLRYFAFHPTLGPARLVELAVPLAATDLARVVRVQIAMTVRSQRTGDDDPRATTLDAGVGPASLEPTLEWQAGPRCV